MQRGAKAWWGKSSRLMQRKGNVSSVPALKDEKNQWVLDAKCKADLFVNTFSKKFVLRGAEINEYTALGKPPHKVQTRYAALQEKDAEKVTNELCADSGTGPDLLPARILKNCAAALAKPVLLLFYIILETGVWPETWLHHWVIG